MYLGLSADRACSSQLEASATRASNAIQSLGAQIYTALDDGHGWLLDGLVTSPADYAELTALQGSLQDMVYSVAAARDV